MTRDEGKLFLAHAHRMLYFFFFTFIADVDLTGNDDLTVPVPGSAHFKFNLGIGSPFPPCISALGCGNV